MLEELDRAWNSKLIGFTVAAFPRLEEPALEIEI